VSYIHTYVLPSQVTSNLSVQD